MTGFNPMPNPRMSDIAPDAFTSMGITAENLAVKYEIDRVTQEAFAIESHARASSAREAGNLADEIVGIETDDGLVSEEGCIRPGTDAETLAGLNPAFDASGSVTAGTSSPLPTERLSSSSAQRNLPRKMDSSRLRASFRQRSVDVRLNSWA